MLKRIVIKNVNSIEKCEIDFSKGNYKFSEENLFGDVVNPIAIYGHNGSGKSSVLNAMSQFISLMSFPVESLTPFIVNNFLYERYYNGGKKNEDDVKGSVSLFFEIEKDEYEYFLETSRNNYICLEYLNKNGQQYFLRKKDNYTYNQKESTVSNLSSIVPLLRILASSEISDSTIQVVFSYISNFVHVNVSFINRGAFVTSKIFNNINAYELMVRKSNEVKKVLKDYHDFPSYSVVKSATVAPNGIITPQYNVVLEDENFKGTLPIHMISLGMHNHSVLLSLLLSMPKNSVMFIDEVDIALHPSALQAFLKVIRDRQIQAILTLHNTNALQVLRPDQIYFAKWSKGFSNYYRLSKIYPNIREVNNIEKMYLSSVFDGAIENNE